MSRVARRLAASLLAAALAGGSLVGCASSPASVAPTSTSPVDASSPCVSDPASVVAAVADSAEPLPADTVAALDQAARDGLAASLAPGAIVGVSSPEGTWTAAYGVADPATGEPMTTAMHTRIGSVTKTFTGTLILQLAEEGLVSLDDPVEKYYPGIPNGPDITLAQLANMTSGIASYTTNPTFGERLFSDTRASFEPDELVQLAIPESPHFAPGTDYEYSNTNTVLLGLIVEQVTGQSIGEALRDRIIEPLALTTTVWPGVSSEITSPYAHGLTLQGVDGATPIDATDWNPSWGFTAGEMISTVDDLLVWGHALGTGQGILDEPMATERLQSFPGPYRFSYGLGVACFGGWVGHEGELPGYNATVFYDTRTSTTVVVQTNSDVSSGDCSVDATLADDPHDQPCSSPAARIFVALAAALGEPFVPNDKS